MPDSVRFDESDVEVPAAETEFVAQLQNFLNSVAIIEATAADPQLYFMVVVMSNVFRKNSAVVHQTLATRIHRMLERYYQVGKFSSNASQQDK